MKIRPFLYISLVVDVVIATSKFIAAGLTGSSSMLSEGVHSVIDAVSQLLLIWGVKISNKRPDALRPFGYGRELYFWSFIVSLIFFLMGGCISFYEGILRFRRPEISGDGTWNYLILALSLIFTSVSMVSALRAFNRQRGDKTFWKAVTQSKDPSTFIVLLGDVGDVISLVVAFLGVYLQHHFHNVYYDAGASVVIGIILGLISLVLVRESKSLLMGEPIGRKTMLAIIRLIEQDHSIIRVKKHYSTYMAPEEVVLQINAIFKDGLTTEDIADAIRRVAHAVQLQYPRIKQIFIEPVL